MPRRPAPTAPLPERRRQAPPLYVVPLAAAKPAAAESAFRFERFGNVSVFYWSEDGCGYALSGDLTREELLPVASSVYEELNAPPLKGG